MFGKLLKQKRFLGAKCPQSVWKLGSARLTGELTAPQPLARFKWVASRRGGSTGKGGQKRDKGGGEIIPYHQFLDPPLAIL